MLFYKKRQVEVQSKSILLFLGFLPSGCSVRSYFCDVKIAQDSDKLGSYEAIL